MKIFRQTTSACLHSLFRVLTDYKFQHNNVSESEKMKSLELSQPQN